MKHWILFAILTAAMAGHALAQEDNCTETPKASPHVSGPHGLEGWTMDFALPDSQYGSECFSATLVLARDGRVIRKINTDVFIWQWIFWNDGRQVAIEEGPLHFGMACVLKDVKTGHTIATYDCYHGLPKDAPEWVKAVDTMN